MALMKENKIYSAYTVKDGGVIEAVSKMAFGNGIGVAFRDVYKRQIILLVVKIILKKLQQL